MRQSEQYRECLLGTQKFYLAYCLCFFFSSDPDCFFQQVKQEKYTAQTPKHSVTNWQTTIRVANRKYQNFVLTCYNVRLSLKLIPY